MIPRHLEQEIRSSIRQNPVTAILGPRQCGKSTLAKHITKTMVSTASKASTASTISSPDMPAQSIYLDLERPSDLAKLNDPEWFLSSQRGKLICMDEIQRVPDLFPVIRSLVDETNKPGQFLLLGSASRDLIKQSSETLAGRISYKKLTPFLWSEVSHYVTIEDFLSKGGFPKSLISDSGAERFVDTEAQSNSKTHNNTQNHINPKNHRNPQTHRNHQNLIKPKKDKSSYDWRNDFITAFLERDLLQFARFTPRTMRRLWTMLAHSNGQTINTSAFGSSLGISHTTVRSYIDLLEGTFMVRQLPPKRQNTKKRLVKSPKVYITNSGITTALLQLRNFEQVAGHPVFGSLWENMVMEEIAGHYPSLELSFYHTSRGDEVDFVLSDGKQEVVVECKAGHAPSLTKGNHVAINDLKPKHTFIVAPVQTGYPVRASVDVVSLNELITSLPNVLDV